MVCCDNCGFPVVKQDLARHHESSCTERIRTCPEIGCNSTFRASQLLHHFESNCLIRLRRQKLLATRESAQAKVSCPNCGMQVRNRWLSHHQLRECNARTVACRFREMGCQASIFARDQEAHEHSSDCRLFRLRESMADEARRFRAEVVCDWCDTLVMQKDLHEHQEVS